MLKSFVLSWGEPKETRYYEQIGRVSRHNEIEKMLSKVRGDEALNKEIEKEEIVKCIIRLVVVEESLISMVP